MGVCAGANGLWQIIFQNKNEVEITIQIKVEFLKPFAISIFA
jgi:hypothetical protein